MPLIQESNYRPVFFAKNGHISTIYSNRIRRFSPPNYQRYKIELSDGDFLNIDNVLKNPEKAVILCHGLEGDFQRTYANSCADFFLHKGYSVFAWNNRSCGGEMNRLPCLYHHASISDLNEVVTDVVNKGFREIYLIGFSMGAAQVMNYFGKGNVPKEVKAAVSISVPISLYHTAENLKKGFNRVYLNMFTGRIKKKLKQKASQFPDFINADKIDSIKTFDEVDEFYTAPLHGFLNKDDYYEKASPAYRMENIKIPILLINAWDDPFLPKECYPIEFAKNHPFVFLEIPRYGGHCAFPMSNSKYAWTDLRAYEFFNSEITSNGL